MKMLAIQTLSSAIECMQLIYKLKRIEELTPQAMTSVPMTAAGFGLTAVMQVEGGPSNPAHHVSPRGLKGSYVRTGAPQNILIEYLCEGLCP
jgi:hypothetical protein